MKPRTSALAGATTRSFAICVFAVILIIAVCRGGGAAEFYVATDGNDAWSGRLAAPNAQRTDGPFATPARARDAVRRFKQEGRQEPVTVLVRAGTYYLAEPLVLTPEDSGSQSAIVTYAAHPGERPVLSAGRRITGWKRPTEGKVWTADVPEVKAGTWYFQQLFVDGQRRVRARMPNDGYLVNEGPIQPLADRQKAMSDAQAKIGFRFKPGDIKRWKNLEDAIVVQFHSWTASVHWIKELDEANHVVRFTAPSDWPTGYWTTNERYYLVNFPEALDAPGEWYLDRTTGVLSYWPPEGEDPSQAEVIAPKLRHVLRIEGRPDQGQPVQWIKFQGLSFQHADWYVADKGPADGQAAVFLESAVLARGAKHVALEKCEIAHVGEYALWLAEGCKENRIVQCHVHDLGGGGIKIGATASPPDEARAADHNVVDNCFIHDTGLVFHSGVGVWIGRSSYNSITHNEICDLNYTGVSVGWSWGYEPSSANHNVVEYNHIHHVGRGVLGDMGGVYTLGISSGTRICHNVVHDVYSPGVGGGTGIYPDEGSTHILIENNLVYHTELGCFSQHYGRENTVRNNILAFSRAGEISRYRQEDHLSFTFEQNIVYSTSGFFLNGGWSNGKYQMGKNLYWDTSTTDPDFDEMAFEDWQALGRDAGSLLADPMFVNPQALDFRLKPDSPAKKIGFVPFDPGQAGLYGDPDWVKLPGAIVRPPLVLPPPEARGPETIDDGFESTAPGQPAVAAIVSGETKGASVRVTEETAATGKRCLKFTDAPGLPYSWQPLIQYSPRLRRGVARLGFAVRLGQDADFDHEWRDALQPYRVGPSIRIDQAGQLVANGKPLATVPRDTWTRLDFVVGLGRQATGTYDLTVTVQGQAPKKFPNLPLGHPGWKSLRWLGFISLAEKPSVIYLDDVKLQVSEPPPPQK